VLDWEFAHLADPREDVAWPLVRAWRFGADDLRLGGVGEVAPYLGRYVELTGREIVVDDLAWWEVLGNAKWAIGALTQSRRHLNGLERSVELAVLGRLAAEMEYELLDLIERHG
jgi:aminoglycoside phosphotransferase (APT) family kinase protein